MATELKTIVLDLGTTAIKAAVCDNNQQLVKIYSQQAPKISIDKSFYFVSDAMDYLARVEELLEQCKCECHSSPLLGICYQRSSFLIWDTHSGHPVTPLISWQDLRGQSSCEELQEHNSLIRQLTGLSLTPYYFGPKLRNLLQQKPEFLHDLLNGKLCVGTLDSFLIWHWTNGKHFISDASMAARTLLMDIHAGQWSDSLTDIFDIPAQILPEICPSNNLYLELKNSTVLKASVADQSAALLSSIEQDNSEVLVNLGTGGFVIRFTPQHSNIVIKDYLNTLIYQDNQKGSFFAIEGTLNSITAALQPYPFVKCTIENMAEIDDIFCIAEPSGIGAPFFRSDIGLEFSKTIHHLTKQQIASLLLEGIIFRIALILEEFNQQSEISRVYLSGGLSVLPCLQQGIAVCNPVDVYCLENQHSGLLGTAILVNNVPLEDSRKCEPILLTNKPHPLLEKYQRWKVWFNQIINS